MVVGIGRRWPDLELIEGGVGSCRWRRWCVVSRRPSSRASRWCTVRRRGPVSRPRWRACEVDVVRRGCSRGFSGWRSRRGARAGQRVLQGPHGVYVLMAPRRCTRRHARWRSFRCGQPGELMPGNPPFGPRTGKSCSSCSIRAHSREMLKPVRASSKTASAPSRPKLDRCDGGRVAEVIWRAAFVISADCRRTLHSKRSTRPWLARSAGRRWVALM